jgi:hypothetical protein
MRALPQKTNGLNAPGDYFSHLGEQTDWDFPNSLRDVSCVRGRCLPHKKHDIVEAPT